MCAPLGTGTGNPCARSKTRVAALRAGAVRGRCGNRATRLPPPPCIRRGACAPSPHARLPHPEVHPTLTTARRCAPSQARRFAPTRPHIALRHRRRHRHRRAQPVPAMSVVRKSRTCSMDITRRRTSATTPVRCSCPYRRQSRRRCRRPARHHPDRRCRRFDTAIRCPADHARFLRQCLQQLPTRSAARPAIQNRRVRLGACAPSPDARSGSSAIRPVTRRARSAPMPSHFARTTAATSRASGRASARFTAYECAVAAFCKTQCRVVPAPRTPHRLGPDRLQSCHMPRSTAEPLWSPHPTHRWCRTEKPMTCAVTATLQYALV